MSHKVHPKVYRIKETSDWKSRGFYKKQAQNLEEDFVIREFLKSKFQRAGIEKIDIERFPSRLNIVIFSSRPGIIIGRRGEGVELLKKELAKKISKINKEQRKKGLIKEKFEKRTLQSEKKSISRKNQKMAGKKIDSINKDMPNKRELRVEIKEVRNPWTSATLSAQWVAQQIEKRVNHRRALKQAIEKISANKEIKGVKIEVSGRLNGVEIARREWLREGRLPLQTIRADIDYASLGAHCTYGMIGVKVWIYKGERFD